MIFYYSETFCLLNNSGNKFIEMPSQFVDEGFRKSLQYLTENNKSKDKISCIDSLRNICELTLLQAKLFVEWCWMDEKDRINSCKIETNIDSIKFESYETLYMLPEFGKNLEIINTLLKSFDLILYDTKQSILRFIVAIMNNDSDVAEEIFSELNLFGITYLPFEEK